MNCYKLEEIQKTLNSIHPKQIVSKVENLNVSMHHAKYKYTTARGNVKEGEKYFLLNTLNPQADINKELMEWSQEYNENNKHRQISNVKFLESKCLGYIHI